MLGCNIPTHAGLHLCRRHATSRRPTTRVRLDRPRAGGDYGVRVWTPRASRPADVLPAEVKIAVDGTDRKIEFQVKGKLLPEHDHGARTNVNATARTVFPLAFTALATAAAADGDRHQLRVGSTQAIGRQRPGVVGRRGLGKLRSEDQDGINAARVFLNIAAASRQRCRPRSSPTMSTTRRSLDLTGRSSVRPIESSRNQHQVRAGAFYPPLSLENRGAGWQSPYSYSYSTINTWLSEGSGRSAPSGRCVATRRRRIAPRAARVRGRVLRQRSRGRCCSGAVAARPPDARTTSCRCRRCRSGTLRA